MKKEYVRPVMVGEEFAVDEYVAACADGSGNPLYKVKCNGAGKICYYYSDGQVGIMDGGISLECGQTLAVTVPPAGYFVGRWIENDGKAGFDEGRDVPVIVWRDQDNYQLHATTNTNMNSWERAKS